MVPLDGIRLVSDFAKYRRFRTSYKRVCLYGVYYIRPTTNYIPRGVPKRASENPQNDGKRTACQNVAIPTTSYNSEMFFRT